MAELSDFDRALQIVLKALKRKDLFAAEIRALLAKSELEAESDAVLAVLAVKLSWNDARVAQALIERSKGKGMERMAAELRRRGASEEVIASIEPVRSETDIARHALAAKFGENFDPAKGWRFLRGRGFSEEVCEEVIPAHD